MLLMDVYVKLYNTAVSIQQTHDNDGNGMQSISSRRLSFCLSFIKNKNGLTKMLLLVLGNREQWDIQYIYTLVYSIGK